LALPETAHRGIDERLDERSHGVGLEDGVAVDHDDELMVGRGNPRVQRRRLAAVRLADQSHSWQVQFLDDCRGAIGGPVVDHDHLDGLVGGQDRADRRLDPGFLVVGRDDHADRLGDDSLRALQTPMPCRCHQDQDCSKHADRTREQEHGIQQIDCDRGDPNAQDERLARDPFPLRGRRLHALQAHRLADGLEREASALEGGDHLRKRGDGLAPVSTRVVHEEDLARIPLRDGVPDDRRDTGPLPVLGVDGGQHGEIARGRRRADGAPHPVVDGVVLGAVGRS